MKEEFQIIKSYRHNNYLRSSLNNLAKDTFGISFEEWYKNGYWGDEYNPYSAVIDGEVAANVSVNMMEFECGSKRRKYIQLGTVMTKKEYRGRGMIRALMEEIKKEYLDKVDGIYLFANDSVLDFYPKFGFRKGIEWYYFKKVDTTGGRYAQHVPMECPRDWKVLEEAIVHSANNSAFELKNNKNLIMFELTQFMNDDVYYIESENAYAVAEIEENRLILHAVYSDKPADINNIISAFGSGISEAVLGFAPADAAGFTKKEVCERDLTLFLLGQGFEEFEKAEVMFPILSHA